MIKAHKNSYPLGNSVEFGVEVQLQGRQLNQVQNFRRKKLAIDIFQ
jgi:hypothetical protein